MSIVETPPYIFGLVPLESEDKPDNGHILKPRFAQTDTLVRSPELLKSPRDLIPQIGLLTTMPWVLDGASEENRYGIDKFVELQEATGFNIQAVIPDYFYTQSAQNKQFPWLSNKPFLNVDQDYRLILRTLEDKNMYTLIFPDRSTFSNRRRGQQWFYALNLTHTDWFEPNMDVSLLLYEPSREYHYWLPIIDASGDAIPYSSQQPTVPISSKISFMYESGIRRKTSHRDEEALRNSNIPKAQQISMGVLYKLVITPPEESNWDYTV